jgi:hypothetical protein
MYTLPDDKSVSKTHFLDNNLSLTNALEFATRLYGRVALGDLRSHHRLRTFIAGLGLAIREGRRDPERVNAACRKARIKGVRLEVRVARLVVGRSNPRKSNQIARWANAAAYVAHPPNGDVPPQMLRDALRYVVRRGGMRILSDLYSHRADEPTDPTYPGAFYYYARAGDAHDGWCTPGYIFDAIGIRFDLDPASPGAKHVPWVPATIHYTIEQDGLSLPWFGVVWLNPPFGRGIINSWVRKFIEHGNGIILVPDGTSRVWWQELVSHSQMILCVNKKIPFYNSINERTGAFPIGTTLVAIGPEGVRGLINAHRAGLGLLQVPPSPELLAKYDDVSIVEAV